jgi:hypothetical protein
MLRRLSVVLLCVLVPSVLSAQGYPYGYFEPWKDAALGTLAITGAILEFLRRRAKHKAEDAKERAEVATRGLREPVQVPPGEKRHSIVLLGLGGSGKTQLIQSLIRHPGANPEQKTQQYAIYHSRQTLNNGEVAQNLYVSDYVGQNLGSLIRAFVLQQFEPYSAMAYGHITAVILVVDLVGPPDDPDVAQPWREMPDGDRIAEQLRQWNDTALDAISGLLTDSLKLFCIFINKRDLVRTNDEDCVAAFAPLIDRVRRRFGRADIRWYVGSAKEGQAVPRLERQLLRTAVTQN